MNVRRLVAAGCCARAWLSIAVGGKSDATIAAYRAKGAKAELREFPGVGHDMPAAVREDLLAHLLTAISTPAP